MSYFDRIRKLKVLKDGRAGRDADGDGLLNEGKDGGPRGSDTEDDDLDTAYMDAVTTIEAENGGENYGVNLETTSEGKNLKSRLESAMEDAGIPLVGETRATYNPRSSLLQISTPSYRGNVTVWTQDGVKWTAYQTVDSVRALGSVKSGKFKDVISHVAPFVNPKEPASKPTKEVSEPAKRTSPETLRWKLGLSRMNRMT